MVKDDLTELLDTFRADDGYAPAKPTALRLVYFHLRARAEVARLTACYRCPKACTRGLRIVHVITCLFPCNCCDLDVWGMFVKVHVAHTGAQHTFKTSGVEVEDDFVPLNRWPDAKKLAPKGQVRERKYPLPHTHSHTRACSPSLSSTR